MRHLIYSDTEYSDTYKAGVQKALKRLFAYRRHRYGSIETPNNR